MAFHLLAASIRAPVQVKRQDADRITDELDTCPYGRETHRAVDRNRPGSIPGRR